MDNTHPCGEVGPFKKLLMRVKSHLLQGTDAIMGDFEEYDAQSPFPFQFEQHCGPLQRAVTDAVINNRALLVFVFDPENFKTAEFVSVLNSSEISVEIERNYIFLPLKTFSNDAITIYESLENSQFPILAIYKTRKDAVKLSKPEFISQGSVISNNLLTALRLHAPRDEALLAEQEREYEEAVEEIENRHERTQEDVDRDFNKLPKIPKTRKKVICVKFVFQDKPRTKRFPSKGTNAMLYMYARKFIFPAPFSLFIGVPEVIRIPDDDAPIKSITTDKQFVVSIDYD